MCSRATREEALVEGVRPTLMVNGTNADDEIEGRWGHEGGCTCAVQHQGLVDSAESVDLTSGKTSPADLQKYASICEDMLRSVSNKLGKLGKLNKSGPS